MVADFPKCSALDFENFAVPHHNDPEARPRAPKGVDAVLRSATMPLVVERFEKDEYDVKKEAAWVVANVMHGYKQSPGLEAAQRVQALVQMGVIKPMVAMLECAPRPRQPTRQPTCRAHHRAGLCARRVQQRGPPAVL